MDSEAPDVLLLLLSTFFLPLSPVKECNMKHQSALVLLRTSPLPPSLPSSLPSSLPPVTHRAAHKYTEHTHMWMLKKEGEGRGLRRGLQPWKHGDTTWCNSAFQVVFSSLPVVFKNSPPSLGDPDLLCLSFVCLLCPATGCYSDPLSCLQLCSHPGPPDEGWNSQVHTWRGLMKDMFPWRSNLKHCRRRAGFT